VESSVTPLDEVLTHPDITRLARALGSRRSATIEAEGLVRYAAIALIIRQAAGAGPELLLIKRAEVERDPWSGHVACPGGRMEPGDRDLEQTAVREAWEETGIDLARDGRILGTLDDITPRTPSLPPLVIRPFVAVVAPDVALVESPEVAEVFWVPLSAIRETAQWGKAFVPIRGVGDREVDVFRHGDYTVWGLTHRALMQFLAMLGE
jgi:8-oxo-dGTP pyrophosphatase MutT (NUDIX family)